MNIRKFQNIDIVELEEVANNISSRLKVGDVVCLTGDLGAGKTTFAKMLIQNLMQSKEEVTSPTFNLVHTYDSIKGKIWHFDLYRLENKEEIIELGVDDAFEYGVSIIEWPQIVQDILPNTVIDIKLSFTDQDHLRDLYIGK